MGRRSRASEKTKVTSQWRSASILDKLFGSDIHVHAQSDHLELIVPYVNNNTPMATEAKEIRGLNGPFLEHAFSRKLIYTTPAVAKTPLLTAYYFPPWHFVSAGRKSRPALSCIYGSAEDSNSQTSRSAFDSKSKNPMDYAVWRRKIKNTLRGVFWKEFQDNGMSPDGTFLFRMNRIPPDSHEFSKEVRKVVRSAKKAYDSPRLLWVDQANKQANIPNFNKTVLVTKNYPPCTLIPRQIWINSRSEAEKVASPKG